MVAIQSDVNSDLLETESMKAIVSVSPGDPKSRTNNLLATLRPSGTSNRVDVKLRTTEGQSGELECLVFQRGSSICQSFYLPIKPLSLHERVADYKESTSSPPMSQITIKGSFGESDMNAWLSLCLPDVPQYVGEGETTTVFRSSFTGSYLVCKCAKGNATLRSDNISALTILKDSIARAAAQRKMAIDISANINDECTFGILKMLHPKIQALHSLKLQAELVDAVKELSLQQEQENSSGEKAFELPEEYQKILTRGNEIVREQKLQPRKLEYIYGIIVDLFMDRARVLGMQNAEARVPALEHILQNYDHQQLVNFFKSTSG